MAVGLSIPVGVNASGGATLASGDANDAKIIKLGLNAGDNENAFQQNITLGEEMIYGLNDPLIRPQVTVKIRQIFDKFYADHRFKLLPNTIKWSTEGEEVSLAFKYLSLETDEEKEFNNTFTAKG